MELFSKKSAAGPLHEICMQLGKTTDQILYLEWKLTLAHLSDLKFDLHNWQLPILLACMNGLYRHNNEQVWLSR